MNDHDLEFKTTGSGDCPAAPSFCLPQAYQITLCFVTLSYIIAG